MNEKSDNELDVEEDNFFIKLKRVLGKYKGKFPFKCFNFGEVGHFADKCPYVETRNSN
jgi:hypothetical protein